MSSPKRGRSNFAEVVQHMIQVQTRALARASKDTTSKESVRERMRADCALLGLHDLDKDLPPVVHIAGTKGNLEDSGSTW
jgi:folylpolyglutamate synthase/dihydropteroate synthase